MGYNVSSWYVMLFMIFFQTDDGVGGEVPRLVAVEGLVEEDGRYRCHIISD